MLCFEAILLLARFIENLSSKNVFVPYRHNAQTGENISQQDKINVIQGLAIFQNRLNIPTALSLYISLRESEKNRDIEEKNTYSIFHLTY